jgi:hypothetical protein
LLKEEWEKIPTSVLVKLVDSMPHRCEAVVQANGFPTTTKCVEIFCGEIGPNVTVLFTKRRSLEGFFAPKLFDTKLILKNQVKYLGVILGTKLNWKFHIDNRIRPV